MTKVISVNSGSSSLKFQLYDMPSEEVLTSGQAERIGLDMGIFTIKVNGQKKVLETPIPDHKVAVDLLLKDSLICETLGQHVVENYTAGKYREWDAYRTNVSSWEIERYLVTY